MITISCQVKPVEQWKIRRTFDHCIDVVIPNLNTFRQADISFILPNLQRILVDWCIEVVGYENFIEHGSMYSSFSFKLPEDAFLFKLTMTKDFVLEPRF